MRKLLRFAAAALLAAASQAHAAWYEAKSNHFFVYAQESPDELRKYATKLERFDQAVRLVRGMDDPALTDSQRVTIFVVPNADAIEFLAGVQGVRGFYITRASGSFAFVPLTTSFFIPNGKLEKVDEILTPEEIFFHEYAHHLQLQNATAIVPTWLSEGFAEFFATAKIDDNGNVTIGKFPQYRAYSIRNRDSLPLDAMIGETYNRKMTWEQLDALYARGWLLTDYLALGDSRKGQLTKYLGGIAKGMTPLASAQLAFGDLNQLQHDMDDYSGHLSEITIQAKVLSVGPITIRPLGPGEAAIMNVRIRSKAGVRDSDARGVASEAAKIASEYPNDAAVQSALAEAEYDAKDYAAASAAASKAIAADSNDVHALIYKGRAEVELAKANPKSANWDSVRQWFLMANKLDTEDAEALEDFYLSFVVAGQRPTQNAVDALLYAADLAPRDTELRLNAVALLLSQNRLTDARSLLAPLAYQPHLEPELHDVAEKAMAAISAGDARAALSALGEAPTKDSAKNKKPANSSPSRQ
jgi:hypothetical protein